MSLVADLARSLPFTLGVIAILLLVLLFELARRLARAAELATDTLDEDAARLETASESGEAVMVDLRTWSSVGPLRRSFATVRRLLRRMLPGRRPLYQTPWLLSLGPAGSGKTTLFGQTRMVLPLGEPDEASGTAPAGCNWWLFDRAVALDTAGDLVLKAAGTGSDQTAWRDFLKLLRRRRARRPADGMLLAIPASELTGYQAANADAREILAERASVLRRKLWRAQERLGMQLPVYLLITKCDLLPGFRGLLDRLSAEERRQIFGWSNADPPETPYAGGWVDTAFRSVGLALARFQLRALGTAATGGDGDGTGLSRDFVAFPAALDRLKEPLRIYMNQIFSATAQAEPFPFRGLYFLGGSGFGEEDEDSPHQLAATPGWSQPASGSMPRNAHRRIDFLADLFDGKILYEWNLARPTGAADRRARRRAWILQTLLFTGLLAGPIGIWAGVHLSSIRANTLDQGLLDPLDATATTGQTSTDQLDERARRALAAAGEVPNYHLQTPLLPWGGKADRDLASAMGSVYRETVFPATREEIGRQLGELAAPAAVAGTSDAVLDVASTPEMEALVPRTSRLRELERDIDRYNCFGPDPCSVAAGSELENFQRLIESVYRTKLRFPTRSAQRFYAGLLRDLQVTPYPGTDSRPEIQAQTLALSDAMFDRLFTGNVLNRDLRDLGEQIARVGDRRPATTAGPAVHRLLLDTIERAEKDLARPEVAWAGRETLDLGEAFKSWLTSVQSTRLLGPETAAEILRCANGDSRCAAGDPRREAPAGFIDFRGTLAAAAAGHATSIGPLLASTDGAVQLQLSEQVQELKAALSSLLAQSFMQPAIGLPLTASAPEGKALFWDPEPLEEAAALIDSFDAFSEEGFASFKDLEPAAVAAARNTLAEQLLDRVSRAQELQDLPPLFTKALQENHIVQQVAELQSVSASLNKVLGALEPPPAAALAGGCADYCFSGPASPWCLVSAILENQQRSLIEEIDALLDTQSFYSPRGGDFSWWDGTGNLALEAFGADTEDDLATWLAGQQRQVKTLVTDYAGPVLTGVQTEDCLGYSSEEPYRRFQVLLADFADVDSETPDNALAETEDFIVSTMAATSLDSCLQDTALPAVCFSTSTPVELKIKPPCDYFLGRRDRLVRGVEARCEDLTVDAARTAWKAISRSFVNRLQDKFPFTENLSGAQEQQTTAADLHSFYQVFDRERSRIDGYLEVADRHAGDNPPPWDEDEVTAVRRFMARIGSRHSGEPSAGEDVGPDAEEDADPAGEENGTRDGDRGGVRDLLSYFLAARADSSAAEPVFDLQVQFRVNQANELAGNQILDWVFEVGDTEIEPGDIDPPGRWSYGEPIRLSLAWAANAPTEPLSPGKPNARLVGRTVIYEFKDAWSLVSLLRQHAAAPRDLTELVDDDPQTLVFSVPTRRLEPEPAEPAQTKKGFWKLFRNNTEPVVEPPAFGGPDPDFTAKAFIRVTLMAPDGSKADLPYPIFPTAVPQFPADAGSGR